MGPALLCSQASKYQQPGKLTDHQMHKEVRGSPPEAQRVCGGQEHECSTKSLRGQVKEPILGQHQ